MKDNEHNRDISSKEVFDDPILCAQLLKDCLDIPALKDIRPEDIEDVSERYHPYLGTEFQSDSVKKIRVLGVGGRKGRQGGEPSFLISLIEHKSLVDHDVSMQLLRYMMCIWTEYRREMETKRKGCTSLKGFRYPVIIPIVYYEGKQKWTAGMQLGDRIRQIPGSGRWIPDFRYELVPIHDYSDKELLERGDEMSLIMLINKIQNGTDLDKFLRISPEELDRIVRHSPEHVMNILVSVMESLCFKIDASAEERMQCVQKVRERKMGYLFENMEKISIKELRQKIEAERQEAEELRQETEELRQEAEAERQKAEERQKLLEEERKRTEEAEQRLKAAEERIRQLEKVM